MKNSWFGYDKNQIRVHFTSLEASQQREIDQWEEKQSLLQRDIDIRKTRLEQLQVQVIERQSRSEQCEQIWPRLELMRVKVLSEAQQKAGQIIGEAVEISCRLKNDSIHLAGYSAQMYQQFTSLVEYTLDSLVD